MLSVGWFRILCLCTVASIAMNEVSQKGVVVSDSEICSNIGNEILNQGGNAVDAAVATSFCTGVVDSRSSGLGGGHFMVVYLRAFLYRECTGAETVFRNEKNCISIDAREAAPQGAWETMYAENVNGSLRGWLAVGVPGELHGLWTAYKRYGGKLPWRTLIEPSINLCNNGFLVSNDLENAMRVKVSNPSNIPTVNYLINPATGTYYKAGEVMTMPALGDTLNQLASAADPVELFYCGEMADKIAKEFNENSGIITKEDLCRYRSKFDVSERRSIMANLKKNLTICAAPPPSSAALTASILNILDSYDFTALNLSSVEEQIRFYHLYIEASRFAYASRSRLGDPDFVPSAMNEAERVVNSDFGEFVKSRITKYTQNVEYYGMDAFVKSDHGTSHISVIDAEGNSVSLTSTINFYFGAGVRSQSTGIIWNNEMDDFSTPGMSNYFGYVATPNNYIKPFKRPLSSMSPMIAFDRVTGDTRLVIGGSGGSRIISIVAQVALRVLKLEQSLTDAIAAPRFHNQLLPDETFYEPEHVKDVIDGLNKLGHKMNPNKSQFSPISTSVVAIFRKKNGEIFFNTDPRRQRRNKA